MACSSPIVAQHSVTCLGSPSYSSVKRVIVSSPRRTYISPNCNRLSTTSPAAKSAPSTRRRLEVSCAAGKFLGKAPPPGEAMANTSSAIAAGAEKVSGKFAQAGPEAGLLSLVIAIAAPVIIGAVISSGNQPSSEWYRNLNKPSWNPPDWLFGAAWSVLYAIIGYSGWLVWAQGGWEAQSGPLTTYIIQLVLNFSWPVICFGGKNLGLALIDIVALFLSIVATQKAFEPVNSFASKLLIPYLLWVAFAAALNYNLWRNNSDSPTSGTSFKSSAYSG